MKRFLLSVLAVVSTISISRAQAVPQGDFESWFASTSGSLTPSGWLTTADVLAAAGFPLPVTTTSRVTGHSGSYAAELGNTSFLGVAPLPGILFLGSTININSGFDLPGGVPFTGRPARLELYYQLTGANAANDSAFVQVDLTRTVGGVAEVVASGSQLFLTPASTFTLATIPLVYTPGSGTPDTLRIGITSSAGQSPTVGTAFTVDDLVLVGTVTATRDALADAALSVYPTSSPDGEFTLSTGTQPALLRGAISVSDATGRVVLRQAAPATAVPSRHFSLRGQAAGVYVLRLETASGPLTRKLIVL
jgi:hypothetical protein